MRGIPTPPTPTLPGKQRLTAAGKRPVRTGSPGLSTPSKSKRGRGVTGNTMAGKAPAAGLGRSAVSRGLFALGFTGPASSAASPTRGGAGESVDAPKRIGGPGGGPRQVQR